MTLPTLLSFLAVFLLVSGAAMWVVDGRMAQFGCLRDWGTGAFIAGGACLGLWFNADQHAASLIAALTAMFYVAGGFLARGMIRFANGRDDALLNRAARLHYPATALMIAVHGLLCLATGSPNYVFLNGALTVFAGVGCIALFRAVALAYENDWLEPPLRCALASLVCLAATAMVIPVVSILQASDWYADGLRPVHHAMVATLSVVLGYSLMWVTYSLYRKRRDDEASIDELTGVLNRNGIHHAVRRHFSGTRSSPIVILQLDIDHFRQINKSYGNAAGDRVLREVARALRTSCRSSDYIARTNGEKFVIACVGADPQTALELAERIRLHVARTEIYQAQGEPISCSVSIGLSAPCGGYANWREAWRQADNALYRAKSLGRNICISHHGVQQALK